MQQILIPTTDDASTQKAVASILNRSLLYNKDEKSLYVKYNDLLHPIGGVDDNNLSSHTNTLSSHKIDTTYAKIDDVQLLKDDVLTLTEELNTLMGEYTDLESIKGMIYNHAADGLFERETNEVKVELLSNMDLSTPENAHQLMTVLNDNGISIQEKDLVICTASPTEDDNYICTVIYKTYKDVTLRDKINDISEKLQMLIDGFDDFPIYEEETEPIDFN